MTSYKPAAVQGALVTTSASGDPLPANQHHALVARTPSDTNTRVAVSTSSPQNVTTNVVVSKQMVNAQGMNVKVQSIAIRSEAFHSAVEMSARASSRPGLRPNEALEPPKPRAPPAVETPQTGAQVGIPTNAPSTTSRAPLPITNGDPGLAPQSSLVPAPQNGGGQTAVCLERTGEALEQAKEMKIDHIEVHNQAGDLVGGKIRGEMWQEGKRQVTRQSMERTDDGEIILRESVHTERVFYRRVFEIMYIAASNEPETPEEPTKKEKCIDCCFQSISCNFSAIKNFVCCKKVKDDDSAPKTLSAVKKIKEMSPILRRGRSKGWVIHTEMIFPLVKASCRNVWVAAEFLAVLVSCILSIISFSLGKNRIFNILHFVLTIVGSILAIIDGFILLKGCCLFAVCKHNREEATDNNNSETSRSNKCCKECRDFARSVFDLIRMIISELLFYPILICDIFELITSETYFFDNAEDGLSFVIFALSLASQLFFVYIVRIAILFVANHHSQKKRAPDDDKKCEDFDQSNSKSAWRFQCYFVFHVCAQMVAQVLMFITIAAAIRQENSHLFSTDRMIGADMKNFTSTINGTINITNASTIATEMPSSMDINVDESIHVSNQLWYMLVAGYILPICGILSFFIVTYFWVQEFPIGICVDVMTTMFETPGIDEFVKINEPNEEKIKTLSKSLFILQS